MPPGTGAAAAAAWSVLQNWGFTDADWLADATAAALFLLLSPTRIARSTAGAQGAPVRSR